MRWTFELSATELNRLLMVLIGAELLLTIAYALEAWLGSPWWTAHRLLDLDGELSLGAWFSSLQLFAVGVVLLLLSLRHTPPAGIGRGLLFLSALVFAYLSADEMLGLHEAITHGLRNVSWAPRFGTGHGSWIPLYLSLGGAALLTQWRVLRSLWSEAPTATLYGVLGAAIFVLGAVGLELIGYEVAEAGPVAPFVRVTEVIVEEFLEMSGVTLILCGALRLGLEDAKAAKRVPKTAASVHGKL